jgi:hypothetical protein
MTIQQETRDPVHSEIAVLFKEIGATLGRLEPDLRAKTLVRSFRGALAPLNASIRRLNDVKLDELSDDQRQVIERLRDEIVLFTESLNKSYAEEADRAGISKELLTMQKRLELPPSALWAVIDYLYESELDNYCDWVAVGKKRHDHIFTHVWDLLHSLQSFPAEYAKATKLYNEANRRCREAQEAWEVARDAADEALEKAKSSSAA